jgi:hypothetical protein
MEALVVDDIVEERDVRRVEHGMPCPVPDRCRVADFQPVPIASTLCGVAV